MVLGLQGDEWDGGLVEVRGVWYVQGQGPGAGAGQAILDLRDHSTTPTFPCSPDPTPAQSDLALDRKYLQRWVPRTGPETQRSKVMEVRKAEGIDDQMNPVAMGNLQRPEGTLDKSPPGRLPR